MRELLPAVFNWIEDQPAWLRPPLYGALLVPAWALARGALFLLPVAFVAVLLTSDHPLRSIGTGLLIFSLAVAGAALSGLAYSLLGRPVRGVPIIGPILAGWLSSWPYAFTLLLIIRLFDGVPIVAPFGRPEWFTFGFGTLYIGAMIGFFLFRD